MWRSPSLGRLLVEVRRDRCLSAASSPLHCQTHLQAAWQLHNLVAAVPALTAVLRCRTVAVVALVLPHQRRLAERSVHPPAALSSLVDVLR